METKLSIVHTNVFGISSKGGNPCPIVFTPNEISSENMQTMSSYYSSETAFVLPPLTSNADIRLKYFVPRYEMEMCVHATVGAIAVLNNQGKIKSFHITVETSLGNVEINLRNEGNLSIILVDQFIPVFSNNTPTISEICGVLGISKTEIDTNVGPIQSVSTSRPKLIIPLINSTVLDSLNPNFKQLWFLCKKYETTGFYPFTIYPKNTNLDVETRQFPNNVGYNEDPATGVAAGALGAYLTKHKVLHTKAKKQYAYKIGQGFVMGKPSIIKVECDVRGNEIIATRVGGTAEIISEETIDINEIPSFKNRSII